MASVKQDVKGIRYHGERSAMFRKVSQSEHIFDFNAMWDEPPRFLERNAKDSSVLMEE